MLERQAGWRERLVGVINSRRGLSFNWRSNNCVQFALDCVAAQANEYPWMAERGKLDALQTDSEVKRTLAADYGSLETLLDDLLLSRGLMHTRAAACGDVVLCRDDFDELGVGVCLGRHFAVLSAEGLYFPSHVDLVKSWGFR